MPVVSGTHLAILADAIRGRGLYTILSSTLRLHTRCVHQTAGMTEIADL